MAVWKRRWKTKLGEEREAWVMEYSDGEGHRHLETFERKKDADARQDQVKVDVRAGVHVAAHKSVTVAEAGESWIKATEAKGRERSTVKQYREHLNQHIVPIIGRLKLSDLNVPTVRKFEDQLRDKVKTAAMVRKVMVSLGSILADAQEQGLAARNAVRELRRNRGKERATAGRRSSRSAWTFRHRMRSRPSSTTPRGAGVRFSLPRSSPGCALRSYAGCDGLMLT